jgi:hypothetical protein
MSIKQPSRIDRRTAEHLIQSAPMGIRDGHPPLAALLTAAAAPGRPDELAGEQASLAAFRTAQLNPVPRPRGFSSVKTAAMKVLTIKAVAIVAAMTAGGVAVAAGTGTLPNPLARRAPAVSSGLSPADATPRQSLAEREPDATDLAKSPRHSKSPEASKSPSPSMVGLCHAYSTGTKDKRGRILEDKALAKLLDNPAFKSLINSAGGKDKVDRFCRAVLTSPAPSRSGDQRSDDKHDDDHNGDRTGGNLNGNSGH